MKSLNQFFIKLCCAIFGHEWKQVYRYNISGLFMCKKCGDLKQDYKLK